MKDAKELLNASKLLLARRSLLQGCVSGFRRNFWLLTSCGRQAGFSLRSPLVMAKSKAVTFIRFECNQEEKCRKTPAKDIIAHQVRMATFQGAQNSTWTHAKQSACDCLSVA